MLPSAAGAAGAASAILFICSGPFPSLRRVTIRVAERPVGMDTKAMLKGDTVISGDPASGTGAGAKGFSACPNPEFSDVISIVRVGVSGSLLSITMLVEKFPCYSLRSLASGTRLAGSKPSALGGESWVQGLPWGAYH